MKDYISQWAHGEDSNPQKQQVSARIDVSIVAKIEQLADIFGVSKTSIIEGALDVGADDLLNKINFKHPLESSGSSEDVFLHNEARSEYEEGKRDYEESQENK